MRRHTTSNSTICVPISFLKFLLSVPGPVHSASFCRALPVPRAEMPRLRGAYYQVRRIVMSPRSTFLHLAAKAGILFGALFLVSVLLAAIPGHRAPAVPGQDAQQSSSSPSPELQPMDHIKMPGMDIDDAKASEVHAVHDMTPGHMDAHNLHMRMTAMRPQTPEDAARANEIATQLRSGIQKYKDYHVALNDGYKIFLPNLPQPEYHFTNSWTGFLKPFPS